MKGGIYIPQPIILLREYIIKIDMRLLGFRPLQFNYLSYELRRQEMSHFGIKKKLKKVLLFFNFFLESATRTGSEMFLTAYSQLNKINQSIIPCKLKGGRYTSSDLRLYYSIDKFL